MNKRKGLAPVLIVLLVALAVGGYLLYQRQTKPAPQSVASTETTNWKTYVSSQLGIEFKYPADYLIKELNVDDSHRVNISYKNPSSAKEKYYDIYIYMLY